VLPHLCWLSDRVSGAPSGSPPRAHPPALSAFKPPAPFLHSGGRPHCPPRHPAECGPPQEQLRASRNVQVSPAGGRGRMRESPPSEHGAHVKHPDCLEPEWIGPTAILCCVHPGATRLLSGVSLSHLPRCLPPLWSTFIVPRVVVVQAVLERGVHLAGAARRARAAAEGQR
jgi:hypothetical protein